MQKKQSFFDAIGANKRNSIILMLLLTFLIFVVLFAFSQFMGMGETGLVLGIIISVLYMGIMYFAGDRMLLALSGAKPVSKQDYPYLYNLVEGLALSAQIPKPKLYMTNDAAMNAYATGRDPKHAAIVVTKGLVEGMNRQELEGVIAHEMSHIGNYDIRYMLITVVVVGLIGFLSEIMLRSFFWGGIRGGRRGGGASWILLLAIVISILTPIIAMLIRLAISREREYLADATAVKLTRYPDGLKNALVKIKNNYQPTKSATETTAPLYFADPIGKHLAGVFSTHPPIDERIKRLSSF